MKNNRVAIIGVWLGALFPLAMVLLFPDVYFEYDVRLFWDRALLWRQDWQAIYQLCAVCDYTFLGTAFTAGWMSLFTPLGYDATVLAFRVFLAMFDAANVFLVYFLLKHFRAPAPHWLAAALGIAAGSWAGSSFWGQIDGITQTIILTVLVAVVQKNAVARSRTFYAAFLAGLGILMAMLLMTKQLGVFSAVALAILIGLDILFYSRSWRDAAGYALLSAGALLLTVLAVDSLLRIPDGYFSHLHYVFATGGSHTGAYFLSVNGINLWMLLGRPMLSSAMSPLIGQSALLSPHVLGRVLFLLAAGLSALPLARLFPAGARLGGGKNLPPQAIGRAILYLAMANLAFNVFLTGTHERYLYHFFPYALLAWYALQTEISRPGGQFAAAMLALCNLYGGFVLMILLQQYPLGTLPHILMGMLALAAFLFLFRFSMRLPRAAAAS